MSDVFDESKITDDKRLVRGEHLLAARSHLRARDAVHHRPWRVMIMSGMSPAGEINAIRELMPKAWILAVDRDPACLTAAIDAGANEVVQCDLADMRRAHSGRFGSRLVNEALAETDRCDIVHLDLCGTATEELKQILRAHCGLTTARGVLILTFSYGRDVVEVFRACRYINEERIGLLERAGVPSHLAERIAYLCGSRLTREQLRSVMAYQGASMPMVSLLFHTGSAPVSYVKVGPGDFELAVTCPDPAALYDCPRDRIESLRRSHAALKAAYTRRMVGG